MKLHINEKDRTIKILFTLSEGKVKVAAESIIQEVCMQH